MIQQRRRAVRSDQGKRRGPQKKRKQEGGGAARGLEKGDVSLVKWSHSPAVPTPIFLMR